MRSSRSVLVILLLLPSAAAGPAVLAGPASASDGTLKTLVREQQQADSAIDRKLTVAAKRIGKPTSLLSYQRRIGRFLQAADPLLKAQKRSYDDYRTRFAAEPSDTPDAERGRMLILQGLKDESRAATTLVARFKTLRGRLVRIDTPGRFKRFTKALDRAFEVPVGERGVKRVQQGRKLIRAAPAAPAPTAR